jgi:hypothetical protein
MALVNNQVRLCGPVVSLLPSKLSDCTFNFHLRISSVQIFFKKLKSSETSKTIGLPAHFESVDQNPLGTLKNSFTMGDWLESSYTVQKTRGKQKKVTSKIYKNLLPFVETGNWEKLQNLTRLKPS